MLADDELPAGCDVHETLRSDGIEASSAGILIVNGNYGKVVAHAAADSVISAEGALVDLGGILFTLCPEMLLLSRGGLYDIVKFILLGLKVFLTDADAAGNVCYCSRC